MSSQRLASVFSCHSWNFDCTILAICPNNSEIHLYEVVGSGNTFVCTRILREHRKLVSSIDWNRGGSFVSCSHDSTASVWSRDGDQWRSELVFTKLKLAALCVRWSPCGRKLAVGSSEKRICLGYWEAEQKRWASKHLRRCHNSSVVALAWHPGGALLATTSTDGRCKVFNAALPGVDGEAAAPGNFGDMLLDVEAGAGWGHAIAWSPSGYQLVASSHGSALHFLGGLSSGEAASQKLEAPLGQLLALAQLPLRCVAFVSETALVGGGFDGQVFLFEQDSEGVWSYARTLTPEPDLRIERGARRTGVSAEFSAKLAMFRSPAKKERDAAARQLPEKAPLAGHSNAIVDMQAFRDSTGAPTARFSTAGWDGRVLLWDACTAHKGPHKGAAHDVRTAAPGHVL